MPKHHVYSNTRVTEVCVYCFFLLPTKKYSTHPWYNPTPPPNFIQLFTFLDSFIYRHRQKKSYHLQSLIKGSKSFHYFYLCQVLTHWSSHIVDAYTIAGLLNLLSQLFFLSSTCFKTSSCLEFCIHPTTRPAFNRWIFSKSLHMENDSVLNYFKTFATKFLSRTFPIHYLLHSNRLIQCFGLEATLKMI